MHKKEEISVKTDTSSLFYASNEPKSCLHETLAIAAKTFKYLCSCAENSNSVFIKNCIHNHAQDSTGNHFSDTDRTHQERNRKRYLIAVVQNKGNDQDIGNDRWQWSQEFVPVAKQIGEAGAQ